MKLSPASLWMSRLVHALTVAPGGVVHASTVAGSRINGRAPYMDPVAPCIRESCSGSGASRGQPCGLPTASTAPTTTPRPSGAAPLGAIYV